MAGVLLLCMLSMFFFFFFNDTATTEIYTLSLHDALPILRPPLHHLARALGRAGGVPPVLLPPVHPVHRRGGPAGGRGDRKSTRLNSSHANISYAVFCLKKKKFRLLVRRPFGCGILPTPAS